MMLCCLEYPECQETATQELRARRGAATLVLVEVGVFVGQLSKFILEACLRYAATVGSCKTLRCHQEHCDFVQLIGVDPYVGADGTFPGNFDAELHPDAAFHHASALYDSFGDRRG